jgi:hypothetical protein
VDARDFEYIVRKTITNKSLEFIILEEFDDMNAQ